MDILKLEPVLLMPLLCWNYSGTSCELVPGSESVGKGVKICVLESGVKGGGQKSQPLLASASQRYERITWQSCEATSLHKVSPTEQLLPPAMKWWFAVRNTNSTNTLFFRKYEGQMKTGRRKVGASSAGYIFLIQSALLYWGVYRFLVLSYHDLFNDVPCFNLSQSH